MPIIETTEARGRMLELRNSCSCGSLKYMALDRLYQALSMAGDQEGAHIEADAILLAFLKESGHEDMAEAWHLVSDAVGFWYS